MPAHAFAVRLWKGAPQLRFASLFIFSLLILSGCGPGLWFGTQCTGTACPSAACSTGATHSVFYSGSGTQAEPFLICTATQFAAIGQDEAYWDAHFLVADNINMSAFDGSSTSTTLVPIGFYDRNTPSNSIAFTGTFDGGGYTISNLRMVSPENSERSYGVFGYTSDAWIKNVNLQDTSVVVTGNLQQVGLLVGHAVNSRFSEITVKGAMTKASGPGCALNCGGMVGLLVATGTAEESIVENSATDVQIQAVNTVGGILGRIEVTDGAHFELRQTSVISNIRAQPAASGTGGGTTIGGAIGIIVTELASTAHVEAVRVDTDWEMLDEPGFLTGIPNSFSGLFMGTAEVTSAGQLTFRKCHASGVGKTVNSDLYGGQHVGGFLGTAGLNGSLSAIHLDQCSVTGTIQIRTPTSSRSVIGGFAGNFNFTSTDTTSSLRDSFARVNILADTTGTIDLASPGIGRARYLTGPTGGLDIQRMYAAGSLSVPNGSLGTGVAGFLGTNNSALTTTSDCYFLNDTFAAALGTGTAITNVNGLDTAGLKNASNYPGWDFTSVWVLDSDSGFPTLRNAP